MRLLSLLLLRLLLLLLLVQLWLLLSCLILPLVLLQSLLLCVCSCLGLGHLLAERKCLDLADDFLLDLLVEASLHLIPLLVSQGVWILPLPKDFFHNDLAWRWEILVDFLAASLCAMLMMLA